MRVYAAALARLDMAPDPVRTRASAA